jgi:hypothetical protein
MPLDSPPFSEHLFLLVCPPHCDRHEVDARLFVIKKVWRAHKDAKSYVTQLCFLEKNKVIFVCVIALRKERRKHDGGSFLLCT